MIRMSLRVETSTEAERFIIDKIQPKCKDEIICRIWVNKPYKDYLVSMRDYIRNLNLIDELEGTNKCEKVVNGLLFGIMGLSIAGLVAVGMKLYELDWPKK